MSTFDRLADLKLEVHGYSLHGLSSETARGSMRRCTIVQIDGAGHSGLGEDVVYDGDAHEAFERAGAVHNLNGGWSLAQLCDQIEELDLFPEFEIDDVSRLYRVWAFESAALDLALRQNGMPLHGALGRQPRPMRYVASLGLGDPPTIEPVTLRLDLDPGLRFKLDATSAWTPELITQLASTGAVDSLDLKGFYRGTIVDQGPDPLLYSRVASAFPNAWIEDPDLTTDETAQSLANEHDRITWDAPIHSIADIEALAFAPRMVNLKPSRIGSLRHLCDTYDYCAEHDIGAYGGGQTELGVGRGQAQYLAAIFHPDGPNDLAPSAYNQVSPPQGLPRSPLTADFSEPGFRWPEN